MNLPILRRATVLAVAASLLATSIAVADTIQSDGDLVTPGAQSTFDLGHVAPGATLTVPLTFQLTCGFGDHVNDGATVTLAAAGAAAPLDGAISTTSGTIGPVVSWPADFSDCSVPAQVTTVGTPAQVTLTAPTAAGGPYTYTLLYSATVSDGDSGAVLPFVGATITLTVGTNTAPLLDLPADITIEGDTIGGADVSYTATATDAQDSPPPTPTCSPASGSLFGLGATSVGCSVTDSGGLGATGSFTITVTDTTPPVLGNVPAGISVGTANAAGAVVTWPAPTATDVVDPAPSVACAPSSGSTFAVGTTIVSCTAVDASANQSQAFFPVSVGLYGALFDAPIGPSNVVNANGSRTLPVKVRLLTNGVEQTAGSVSLSIATCGGGAAAVGPSLTFDGARWTGKLDTTGLGGCQQVSVLLDGVAAGSFQLNQPALAARPTTAKGGSASNR